MATDDIGSIGDRPIHALDDDQLGIKDYATALRQFVTECDTPLTVGIQGDWGSGKTSLMNLMRPKPDDKAFTSVWINTWKYQQLGDPEVLFLAVLSGIVDELCKEAPKGGKELGKKVLGWLAAGTKIMGRADSRCPSNGRMQLIE